MNFLNFLPPERFFKIQNIQCINLGGVRMPCSFVNSHIIGRRNKGEVE